MSSTSPLGRPTPTPERYDAGLLHPVPRAEGREVLGLTGEPPFDGVDVWNAWELSWLDERGRPCVATAELRVPASSPALVESKSLKLYLHSLNAVRLGNAGAVAALLARDLSAAAGAAVAVRVAEPPRAVPGSGGAPAPVAPSEALPSGARHGPPAGTSALPGRCLDDVDVAPPWPASGTDEVRPAVSDRPALSDRAVDRSRAVEEALHTHLFRSRCPVTGQPDWASVLVDWTGPALDHEALLRYLVSFRDHAAFHEHVVERVFVDLWRCGRPEALAVQAFFTRRGGLDINPYRSSTGGEPPPRRVWRQ